MKKPIKPLEELLDSVRDIEGFPVGKDEDILSLSDPPYYTASPNPYISDFIEEYGKPYDEATDDYHREPYMGDVSENKYDSIYRFHSYLTKVPPKAIQKFLRHYAPKKGVVLDCFGGTGMTGVATKREHRNCILIDISTNAYHISKGYNSQINNLKDFEFWFNDLLDNVESELSWLYEIRDNDGIGKIKYTVWSEVLECPFCGYQESYWDIAVEYKKVLEGKNKNGKITNQFNCTSCNANIEKKDYKRVLFKGKLLFKPVLFNYQIGKNRKERLIQKSDFDLINKIEKVDFAQWVPDIPYMYRGSNWGDSWRAGYHQGIETVSDFFSKRALIILSEIWARIKKDKDNEMSQHGQFIFTSTLNRLTRLVRYMPQYKERNVGPLSGTLYIPSLYGEINVFDIFRNKFKQFNRYRKEEKNTNVKSIIGVQSATDLSNIPDNSIDYVFVDPPFGNNLMYSELNFIIEAWLGITTNLKPEAIIANSQGKNENDYKELILKSFKEIYKKIKPNRWLTVEFHNSKSAIWNAIQDSITKAGFVIGQVVVIDKKKGTTKQMTYSGTVNNDLVIAAYKPKKSFSRRFLEFAGEGLEEEFIRMHLSHLKAEITIERTEQMLYSKLIAYYVQRGYTIKYDASTFYKMLRQNFIEEDGYWFNSDQIENYREFKQKMKLDEIDEIRTGQLLLFVADEKSAIVWLNAFLNEPKDFQTIHPAYTKISNIAGDNVPDIKELLEKNFILENGKYRRPKTEDEKMSVTHKRERELQREFDELLLEAKGSKKKIKDCRKQAVIFGFEQCYKNNRFQDILELGRRLDKKIVENDSEISEFMEVAELKVNGF
jgi:DNA modification methylase